jgi:hypothetical protein
MRQMMLTGTVTPVKSWINFLHYDETEGGSYEIEKTEAWKWSSQYINGTGRMGHTA